MPISAHPAQVVPNRGFGFFSTSTPLFRHSDLILTYKVLGASLHDTLCRLKAQPQNYPTLELSYSPTQPLQEPVLVTLPANGFRLRFDGPDQRLRLIEVLDFTKTTLTYKNTEIVKAPREQSSQTGKPPTGPTFRHVYNRLIGPTFPGEYLPPGLGDEGGNGIYILSYPGIAFSFPFQASAWSPDVDFVSLLSSSAASSAVSMAIYDGSSWSDTRSNLFTRSPPNPRSLSLGRAKEGGPDEVELVKIHGAGHIELSRRSGVSLPIILGETTPQDLVAELGPPDAIYRKNDRRLSIHQIREQGSRLPQDSQSPSGRRSDMNDTDQSASTDESGDDELATANGQDNATAAECFYNYFNHGFDIFISNPTSPSPRIPVSKPFHRRGDTAGPATDVAGAAQLPTNHLTATKLLLHGNVPGSYPFNRHRRSRWTIGDVDSGLDGLMNSEMSFEEISTRLKEVWKNSYAGEDEEKQLQRGMVLNRGWGDSPGSSCELLGGWEDSVDGSRKKGNENAVDTEQGLGNTVLFGFPGMVFEVLKNGAVSCLTVY